MKKLDRLHAAGVHNSHNLTRKGDYLVTFTSYHGQGRFPTHWGWYLFKRGFKFKGSGLWDQGGRRLGDTDFLGAKDRDTALGYAAKICGEREWARDPFGAWQPAAQLKARLAKYGVLDPRVTVVRV